MGPSEKPTVPVKPYDGFSRPRFEYEVRELLDIPASDYERSGLASSPFYYFGGPAKERDLRKDLTRRILGNGNKFPYVTGHVLGGSGKTFALSRVFRLLSRRRTHAVIAIARIVRYRYAAPVVHQIVEQVREFCTTHKELEVVAVIDEVEFPEVYATALENADRVIAGGHYLRRDVGSRMLHFQEIDIDAEYPIPAITKMDILTRKLYAMRAASRVSEEVLRSVVELAPTLGNAEFVIGLLIATSVRRHLEGRRPTVTKGDVEFWLSVFGTNWFWYSMDCWRVCSPIDTLLKCSVKARYSQILLRSTVHATCDIKHIE